MSRMILAKNALVSTTECVLTYECVHMFCLEAASMTDEQCALPRALGSVLEARNDVRNVCDSRIASASTLRSEF